MKVKGIHSAPALAIVVSALLAAANYLDINAISGTRSPFLTLVILEIACIGLPSVFFCILKGVKYGEKLRLRITKTRNSTVAVYALFMLICGSVALSFGLYKLFPTQFSSSGMAFSAANVSGEGVGITAALTFGIVPAILEEFLCRGIIFAEYSSYGRGVAIVFSSLIFSMLHFSPVRLPIYFFAGIILALTASVTNSVITSAIVHVAYNLFVLFFEKYIYTIAAKNIGGVILMLFIVITGLLLSALLFFGKAEKIYKRNSEENIPTVPIRKREAGDSPFSVQALISPTFIILVVFYIFASVML